MYKSAFSYKENNISITRKFNSKLKNYWNLNSKKKNIYDFNVKIEMELDARHLSMSFYTFGKEKINIRKIFEIFY